MEEIFKTQANGLWNTLNCHGGSAGFRIPEYQRTYDWNQERIGRLLEDCASGFAQLRKQGIHESYTFLGTLILVNEESESDFDGTTLAVVDGQQRLTTLLLICCALVEKISANLGTTKELPSLARKLIDQAAKSQIGRLYECIVGECRSFQQTGKYPRIVRHNDERAIDPFDACYHSTIAKFLLGFADYYSSANVALNEFSFPFSDDDDGTRTTLRDNYDYIKQQIAYITGLS